MMHSQVVGLINMCIEQNMGITIKLSDSAKICFKTCAYFTDKVALREMKITLKIASIETARINLERKIELRKEYVGKYPNRAANDSDKMIFIDECGFDTYLRLKKARLRRGTRANVIVPSIRG